MNNKHVFMYLLQALVIILPFNQGNGNNLVSMLPWYVFVYKHISCNSWLQVTLNTNQQQTGEVVIKTNMYGKFIYKVFKQLFL